MSTAIRRPAKILILNVIVSFLFLALISTAQALVVQMDRQEVIQRSSVIFEGSVLEKNARWNDKGNLIVTDYVFAVHDAILGEVESNQLTLTFAGGQLEEEGQSVSDVPEFEVGDVVLLMLEESAHPLFSPVTGGYQGKFVARNMAEFNEQVMDPTNHGNLVAFDGKNQPVRNNSGDVIAFDDFVEMVRDEIPVAKSQALPDRSVAQELESIVEKELPSQMYDPLSVTSSSSSEAAEAVLPTSEDQNDDILPEKDAEVVVSDGAPVVVSSKNETHEYYSYNHTASGRITWNQLRNYNHDQYMMAYWNKYGDIYRVRSDGGTGTWAWGNGRYDMAGWPDNAAMVRQFGSGWSSTWLAVTYSRWNIFGTRVEADIAMNPAFSWTLDDCYTYNHSNVYNIHRTFLHELGHGWGLAHQWYYLSVMNYAPKKFRAYTRLQADDTQAVRAAYAYDVSRRDYGVNGHYANGYQNYTDSIVTPTTVTAGSVVDVDHFIIDNTGTYTVYPKVEFYLVPNICSWSGNRYIGTVNFSAVGVFSYGDASNIKLTIPADTPAGNYYLAAYIRDSSDTLGDNNSTWIDRRITVSRPAIKATVLNLYDPAKYTNDLTPGGFAYLWAYVKNEGSQALPKTARVYSYVTGPGGFAQWVYVSVAGLASNTGNWYRYRWNIPADQAPGTYQYWSRVWDTAASKWLGDGKCCQNFVIKAGVAADVTSLYDPIHYSDLRVNGYATLWAYVKNTGGQALPSNAKVWYYVTGPGGFAKYVGSASVAGLAAGAGGWKSFKWSLTSIATGTYQYWARVYDSDAGRWLGAGKCCQSFLIPTTASILEYYPPYGYLWCGGNGYAYLLAKVKNESNIPFPSDSIVQFWVQGPGINGYVGTYPVGGLAAGATKTWAYTRWSIPNNSYGTYYYWARVYSPTKGYLSVWRTPAQKFVINCLF